MMNIASHRIPPVPVDASSSAPGDRAGGWKWGLFIFYTDASISRKAKSSSFCDVVNQTPPWVGSSGDADAPSA